MAYGGRAQAQDKMQVGTVLVIENLRPETTESEIRKLLREIWLPVQGKQMYDAGRGQARTCGVDPYVKMTCAGGVARVQMADASLAGQLWCAFPGTYQGRKLKMRRESVDPGQVRPSAGAYEMKQRPDFTQPIAQSCVETATGVAERWVPVRTQMESAGDRTPADFNPKGSMINDRRLMDHRGGYTGLMDQIEVTQPPGEISHTRQDIEPPTLCNTRKQWLTSSLDLGMDAAPPDYFHSNPGGVKPGMIQQPAVDGGVLSPELSPAGKLQGVPIGYGGHSRHMGGGGELEDAHCGNWTANSGLGHQAPVFSPHNALDPHNYSHI